MVGGSKRKLGVPPAFVAGVWPAGGWLGAGWIDGFAGCEGVCAGAAAGRLTRRNSIVFAVPMSIARWLRSFTSVPRMTCGVMAKTVSSVEWSVVVWPQRYFKIGIWANPGMQLSDLVWESSRMPPIKLDSPSLKRISPKSTFFWRVTGWVMPPMFAWLTTEETSMVILRLTSGLAWT